MIGDKFVTLSENQEYDLFNLIEDHNPDYIMIEEFSETFMPEHIMKRLYSKNRTYKIFETTHSSHTQVSWKRHQPDKFIMVSPYSLSVFKDLGIPMDLIEYPVNDKEPNKQESIQQLGLDPEYKHIINIGLFTEGKNQGYAFEIARILSNYKIKFHFLGNQASNFVNYWQPLMNNKPENCIVWGERNDTDTFIQASDIHLFTSRLELNPLSIKESLEYHKPTLIFDLHTYMGKYNDTEHIHFLSGDVWTDANTILKLLGFEPIEQPKLKIKVVHLLLDPNEPEDIPLNRWESTIDRQNYSLSCWDNLKHKFYDYVPRYTKVNRTELPIENCKDPDIINYSKEFNNKPPVLCYGHYGAYKAHTDGILENFDEDLDALIVVEGDAYTNLSPDEFYNKVIEGYTLAQQRDSKLISFAGPLYLTGGEWWNQTIDLGEWLDVHHFLLGTTYMIMKSEREHMINTINTNGWHSPDIWLAWVFGGKIKMLTRKNPIVYQKEGYSVLDYKDK
jgi:hypothetical protein